MSSVTQRINQIQQPYGGYIPPKKFYKTVIDDGVELHKEENIHPSLVGTAVDYLTRCIMGARAEDAFKISLLGAKLIGEEEFARNMLSRIKGVDDISIICACKLAGYDVCVRAGDNGFKPVSEINPNEETIFNIRKMVERGFVFLRKYGPIIKEGFTFEGGYTNTIDCGDGDFLTEDTLWDFKVSKNGLQSKHTLQLLVYYIMGCRSIHPEFLSITKLGVFNPRLNAVFTLDIAEIDQNIIEEVSEVVIGYGQRPQNTENFDSGPENWTLDDLADRYGVGKAKITGDFFEYGLPYYKIGRSYRFVPEEVMDWEVEQRSIPYGKKEEIVLPECTAYGEYLQEELRSAKANRDKEEVREIKREIKARGYKKAPDPWNWLLAIEVALVLAVLYILLKRWFLA